MINSSSTRCLAAAIFPLVLAMLTAGVISHALRTLLPGWITLAKGGGFLCAVAIYLLTAASILRTHPRTLPAALMLRPGTRTTRGMLKDAALCLSIGVAVSVTVIALVNRLNATPLTGTIWLQPEWSHVYGGEKTLFDFLKSEIGLSFFGVMLVSVVFEEVVFRGFIFGTLRLRFSPALSTLATTLLFAALHGTDRFVLSIYAALIFMSAYLITRRLSCAILVHLATNLTPPFLIYFGVVPSLWGKDGTALLWGWLGVATLSASLYALYRFNRVTRPSIR